MPGLLQRIAEGDESAIAACLDEYGDLVWRLARRYLDRADDQVEDAVQEVFIEIWLAAERFDPEKGSEPAFVATIAHRRLTDIQRRIGARRRAMQRYTSQIEAESRIAGSSGSGEPKATATDAAEEALATIPEAERDTLVLWLYCGLTQRQIGEATGAPLGTVKSRMRRGILRVCNAIKPETGGTPAAELAATQEGGVQ